MDMYETYSRYQYHVANNNKIRAALYKFILQHTYDPNR